MSIQFDLQNAEKCRTFALGNQRRAPLCERQALFNPLRFPRYRGTETCEP